MWPLSFRQISCSALLIFAAFPSFGQSEQIQIAPPTGQIQSPPKDASVEQLEKQADQLRGDKEYLDAVDYYRAALAKEPQSAKLSNKLGIAELMLERYKDAGKDFEQAIKKDRKFAEPYNNFAVVEYKRNRYRTAIKQYKKAIELAPDNASFFSNLGAAYFARKEFEQASRAYAEAIRIDPEIFEHRSHTGIAAQLTSSVDRAHYDYVLAKLYAKVGDREHSLEYLRKAKEEGYKEVNDAYTAPEFAEVRKDARFAELMKQQPPAIPE